ncbi:MAG: helix-turn-helix domain-containing protein [Mobilitalea sp.]
MDNIKNEVTQHAQSLDIKKIFWEIFNTDNVDELKEIARKAEKYDQLFLKSHPVNTRGAGRKAQFSEDDIELMVGFLQNGNSIQDIALQFNTSRQTISKYLSPSKRFEANRFVTMRMRFMHQNTLCTIIDIDFMHRQIYITNFTNDIIHRAFGVVKNPTWEDFEFFIESRCVPKSRSNIKSVLRDLGVSSYDPLQIIEKTKGRMAEDNQWIDIVYKNKETKI